MSSSKKKWRAQRKRSKKTRAKKDEGIEIDLDVLFAEELLMDVRMRNTALELAEKRKLRYIQ